LLDAIAATVMIIRGAFRWSASARGYPLPHSARARATPVGELATPKEDLRRAAAGCARLAAEAAPSMDLDADAALGA
jgi:hypothetical protein